MLYKILSCTMALLLLASTTSWAVDKHFCMGYLVDVAFFADAETCSMSMGDMAGGMEMECCSDEVIVVDGQDDLILSFNELSLDQQILIASFTYTYIDLFEGLQEQVVPLNDYPPPLLTWNLQLLDQVFLI